MPEITNEVIVERIEGLKLFIETKFLENTKDHERIEAQTKKTNGRVNSLETWRNRLVGAIAVVTAGSSVVFAKIFNLF